MYDFSSHILQAGSQQSLSAVSVPSSVPVPSKVSSIYTNNANEGVSIRSDEVTVKSSTDGSAMSAAGKSSNLSLDALAKAKKALQLKKELSEKLKKLPMVRKHSYSQSLALFFNCILCNCSNLIFPHTA
jgi:U4/U6 small nuclear ribonucleoprotein PRP3